MCGCPRAFAVPDLRCVDFPSVPKVWVDSCDRQYSGKVNAVLRREELVHDESNEVKMHLK